MGKTGGGGRRGRQAIAAPEQTWASGAEVLAEFPDATTEELAARLVNMPGSRWTSVEDLMDEFPFVIREELAEQIAALS